MRRLRRVGLPASALVALLSAGIASWLWWSSGEPCTNRAALASPRTRGAPNRLALEASPYLQLHAHNPVDWYPWGDEALERARAEDKPIFLSIGYSTCYWCHVMEREVFSDPTIGALLDDGFVSIKVDREERPDIDEIYMSATQLLTGSGGWPNSVFLTPDGRPFYAGTYFPPGDVGGRPGFPRVLRAMRDMWASRRDEVLAAAERVAQQMRAIAQPEGSASGSLASDGEVLRQAIEQLHRDFDVEHGGLGRGMKFPRPPALELLLVRPAQEGARGVEEMLDRTLRAMALGGIYDHLGGGFHRYSTERTWSLPHFEKMLYDNAQLVGVYARAYEVTQRPLYRRVVARTVVYLEREMSHPEGGFYSAQDAEVDGQEGASYVWSRDEIEAALGQQRAAAFFDVYELSPLPDHDLFGVLRVRLALSIAAREPNHAGIAELLASHDDDLASLLELRSRRRQPLRDDKVLAAWNGLAIRGLVDAAAALAEPRYLRRAERTAAFALDRLMTAEGALRRSYIAGQVREEGVLDDYAFLADGLLALHRATGGERWLAAASRLADAMLDRFEDESAGAFFLTPADSNLLLRPKPFEDHATPSGNAVALRVLRELGARPGGARYARAAAGIVSAAAPFLERAPAALPATVAVLAGSTPVEEVTVLAGTSQPPAPALPRSEDHVRAAIVGAPDSAATTLLVRLRIDEGWHVNANPASFPFLVPTSVEGLAGPIEATIRYPDGRSFRPAFAPDPIEVYEGEVEIAVTFDGRSRMPERLAVRFQACDATSCLPPGRAVLAIGSRGGVAP
jgi:hypothetical protein